MSKIFVDPQGVKDCSGRIKSIANEMMECLNETKAKMISTETNFQSQAATDMRDKFSEMQGDFQKFEAYLNKIAAYLDQNVADPVAAVNAAAVKNVASIRKPKA